MTHANHLDRFVVAQKVDYDTALAEIKAGKKKTHWMWYIFPQIQGLGLSSTSMFYAIEDLAEATAYLGHPVLGKRLMEISRALLGLKQSNAKEIFGSPDDMKLRSCMTLFAMIDNTDPVFKLVLEKFFDGHPDEKTMQLIKR
jgi:uncharacterized protein (DUF1810 family)